MHRLRRLNNVYARLNRGRCIERHGRDRRPIAILPTLIAVTRNGAEARDHYRRADSILTNLRYRVLASRRGCVIHDTNSRIAKVLVVAALGKCARELHQDPQQSEDGDYGQKCA